MSLQPPTTDSWLDDVESFFSIFSRKKDARDPLAEKCNQKSAQVQKQIAALESLPKLKGYQQTCQERLQKAMQLPPKDGLAELGELSVEISSQVQRHQEALAANEKLAVAEKEFADASKLIARSVQDLQKTPGAIVDKAKKLHEQAVAEAGDDTIEGYAKGVATLKLAEAEIRSQAAVATEAAEEAKKQLGKKPDYEKRLAEAQAVIGKIAELPSIGIALDFKKLQARVEAAKAQAAKGQYGPALEALGDFSKVKVEEFAKESAQIVKGLQQIPAAAKSEAALNALRKLEPPIAWKADRQAVNLLLSAALDAPDQQQKTLAEFGTLAATLEEKVAAREKLRVDIEALLQKLAPAMTSFRETASPEQALPHVIEYNTLPRLRDGGQFEMALATGQSLLDRVEKTTLELKAAAAEWEKSKAEAADLYVKLQAFTPASKPAPPAFLVGQASPLAWLVLPKLIAELTKAKDWPSLHANLARVRDAYPALPVQLKAWQEFRDARDDAAEEIQARLDETGEALNKLADRLDLEISEAAAADMQEVAPFREELKSIESGWQSTLAKAIDAGTLNQADFASRLGDLLGRIQAAGSDQGFQKLVGQAAARDDAEAFKKSYAAFEARLGTLRNAGPGKALVFAARAEKIQASGAGDWAGASGKLGELDKEVTSELDVIKQTRVKLGQEVEKHLVVLNRDLKKVVDGGDDNLKKAGLALNQEAKLLFAQVRSENLDAATFALAEIERLMARVEQLFAEFKGGAKAVAGRSVSEAVARGESIERRWQELRKELQTYTDAREKELKKEWDKLKASVPTLNPNAALGRLLDFDHSLTLAFEGAERVKALDADVTANLELAKTKLETLTKRETKNEKYTKSLLNRLETAEKMAKDKTQLYGAQSRLEDLLAEIGADLESVTSVAQKAAELQANEDAAAEADKAWGPAKEQVKAKLDEVEAIIKAQEGDPGLLSELKALFALAQKTAGDDKILNKVGITNDGDRATALRQLQVVEERARQIIADPVGPTIGSRNQLPKDVENYKANLQALLAVVTSLPGKVQNIVPGLTPPVSQKFTSLLQGATRSLSLHAFDSVVERMTRKDTTPAQQRELRELALGQARQIRDTLTGHPQLQALREVPVETAAVTSSLQRLLQALTRLEANLNRSCR